MPWILLLLLLLILTSLLIHWFIDWFVDWLILFIFIISVYLFLYISIHVTTNHSQNLIWKFYFYRKYDISLNFVIVLWYAREHWISHYWVLWQTGKVSCTLANVQLGCFFFFFFFLILNSSHDRCGVFCCLEPLGCISVYISDVAKCIPETLEHKIFWTRLHFNSRANMRFVVCLHIKKHLGTSSRHFEWQPQYPYFCKQVELQV